MEEIIKRLEANNRALEYAAYNYDGSILEDLEPNVIESTGVGTTCLIEIRDNKILIDQLRASQKTDICDHKDIIEFKAKVYQCIDCGKLLGEV